MIDDEEFVKNFKNYCENYEVELIKRGLMPETLKFEWYFNLWIYKLLKNQKINFKIKFPNFTSKIMWHMVDLWYMLKGE